MQLRSTPASAVRHSLFSPSPWMERPGANTAATPAERRLSAQVQRTESSLRDVHDELDERTALLQRTKKSVQSLQNDLQRARESEAKHREVSRERFDADARRIAELERQLASQKEQGNDKSTDVNRRVLVDKVTSLEEQVEHYQMAVVRLESELALRASTAEQHRADSVANAKTIEQQRIAIEEARTTIELKEKTLNQMEIEKEQRAATIRQLVASASELRDNEKKLTLENGVLKNALREAATKHEVAMAQAELALRRRNGGGIDEGGPGVSGNGNNSLAIRLEKLQLKVSELAQREVKVLHNQTVMREEMDSLRVAGEAERVKRVEAEAKGRLMEEEFRRKIREKDDDIGKLRAELSVASKGSNQ